ncbi:HigA family addiction module antitoxin [Desulfobacterales bacterium HSG17]|nr:HigA family addiction module antitoxin [Desulfobacterales bacterium HSG17]
MAQNNRIKVEHPGVILKEEFMEPFGISAYKLSKTTKIDKMTLSGIINGKKSITPITALKISKFFGLSERFWINLQSDYELRKAKLKIIDDLENIDTIPEALTV